MNEIDPLKVFQFGEDGRMYVHGEEVVLVKAIKREITKLRAVWRDDKDRWSAEVEWLRETLAQFKGGVRLVAEELDAAGDLDRASRLHEGCDFVNGVLG